MRDTFRRTEASTSYINPQPQLFRSADVSPDSFHLKNECQIIKGVRTCLLYLCHIQWNVWIMNDRPVYGISHRKHSLHPKYDLTVGKGLWLIFLFEFLSTDQCSKCWLIFYNSSYNIYINALITVSIVTANSVTDMMNFSVRSFFFLPFMEGVSSASATVQCIAV